MRRAKQFLYALFYGAAIFLIVWGINKIFFGPAPSCFDLKQNQGETGVDCGGPCIDCKFKNLQLLEVQEPLFFSDDRRSYAAAIELKNPNLDFTAKFKYAILFQDQSGKTVEAKHGDSFLYSGKNRYLVEAARITTGIPVKASLEIDRQSIQWLDDAGVIRPPHEIRNVSVDTEDSLIVVTGEVFNSNSYSVSRFDIGAFATTKDGAKIGVSRTDVRNVASFEAAKFTIFIPVKNSLIANLDTEATAMSVFVDVLK